MAVQEGPETGDVKGTGLQGLVPVGCGVRSRGVKKADSLGSALDNWMEGGSILQWHESWKRVRVVELERRETQEGGLKTHLGKETMDNERLGQDPRKCLQFSGKRRGSDKSSFSFASNEAEQLREKVAHSIKPQKSHRMCNNRHWRLGGVRGWQGVRDEKVLNGTMYIMRVMVTLKGHTSPLCNISMYQNCTSTP